MKNIGAAMAGGNGTRRENDFYPTPPEAVLALIDYFDWRLPERIWEPACGDGALSKVLLAGGRQVVSTDLVDRGFGESGVDFLACTERLAPAVVTNPPFNLAVDFIEHSYVLGVEFLALLLKATFFNAANRVPLFDRYQLSHVLPLTWRIDFTGQGAPTMDCCWYVWDGTARSTLFQPLRKPRAA